MVITRYSTLAAIATFILISNCMGQSNIDSFLQSLHNNDVRSKLSSVGPSKTYDSGRIYIHTTERLLTSVDVSHIKESFPRKELIEKLVTLLKDTTRDWYADLLLYNLTREPSLNILACNTREQWLKINPQTNRPHQQYDVDFWQKYAAGLPPDSK